MPSAFLLPTAVTGVGQPFAATEPVFLEADVGRQIIFGASRATIKAFGSSAGDTTSPNQVVFADIIDDFPNLDPIPPDQWFLRLSPQSDLDPNRKGPVGAYVALVANKPTFRMGDLGKFISIYGGIVRITHIDSVIQVQGEILSEMSVEADDPDPAPAGSWTMNVSSWSAPTGFPRTAEFYQGRLAEASTTEQPTTFWLSSPDNFDNYAIGVKADDAIEYTIASRQINRLEWMADVGPLLIGTSGNIFRVDGQNSGDPLGGDQVPVVNKINAEGGSSPIQPVLFGKRLIYFDRGLKKAYEIAYNVEEDGLVAKELTTLADHILGSGGVRLRGVDVAIRPDPRVFHVRRDGQMAVLTYFPAEKVVGFTRLITDGTFEAVAVVPQGPGSPDRVYTVVQRTIGGVARKYVEYFYDDVSEFTRGWGDLHTDSAVCYTGPTAIEIPGLGHLEGKLVDVVADGSYRGQRTVTGGKISLSEPATQVEVGLKYDSWGLTQRPAIEGSVIEGMPRSWDKSWFRVYNTIGGKINGREIRYPAPTSGQPNLYSGDREVTQNGWDTDGRLFFEQTQPYPMTILALFGTLSVGDRD